MPLRFPRSLPAVLLLIAGQSAAAQTVDPGLPALLEEIRTDSMRVNLEILTGERSLYIGDSVYTAEGGWLYNRTVTIPTRYWPLNDLPAEFLRRKLASFGLETWLHKPLLYPGVANVMARIPGAVEPSRQVLIGAHYDAVEVSPGADDNGSGTVAVLEIARVLAGSRPDKTILFALWDAEEVGLVGSTRYAQEAYARGDRIEAVINLDMIGWNRGDPVLLVTSYDPYSGTWLEDRLLGLASGLSLPLDARSHSMGRSDHVPFATLGYESVMLIEDYGNDFNPYYHSNFDTIDKLDFAYLTAATRLAAAGVVSAAFGGAFGVGTEVLALPVSAVGVPYPNPASGPVRFAGSAPETVALYDLLGRRVAVADTGDLDVSGLPEGVYVYRASVGTHERTGTLVVHR